MASELNFPDMSKQEFKVFNWLHKLKIRCIYQNPVFLYDEKNRPRVWTPDFYLPQLGIHIEVCGSKNFKYEYRDKIYKLNNIEVIFIHSYKPKNKWTTFFREKLRETEEKRRKNIDKLMEILPSKK